MTKLLKALFITALATTSLTASAASSNERLCLISGKLAAAITETRNDGTSEERVLEVLGSDTSRHTLNIVAYVFTNNYSKQDNRELVYLKCKAGAFD